MRTYLNETYRALSEKARETGKCAERRALAEYVRSLPDTLPLFVDVGVIGSAVTYTAKLAKFNLRND